MTLEEKKNEIEEHFNLWIGNYTRKDLTTNNVRIAAEAVCKAVILHKLGEIVGTKIILGKDPSIPKKRTGPASFKLNFADLITCLKDIGCGNPSTILQLELIRQKTNTSSHSKNSKKDVTTLEDLDICQTEIKSVINWLYKTILNTAPSRGLQGLLDGGKQNESMIDFSTEKWRDFEMACHNFDKRTFQYIFIAPEKIAEDSYTVSAFAKLPWRLVIDFDPKTDENVNGLLFNFNNIVGQGKKKAFTIKNKIEFDQSFPHYWFLANGQGSVLPITDYKPWRNQYKTFLSDQLYSQFLKGSRLKSRIVVLLNIAPNYAQDIIDEFNRKDEQNLKFILCSETNDYEGIFDKVDNAELIKISPIDIAHGVNNSLRFESEQISDSKILIPYQKDDTGSNSFIHISQDHYDYLHSLGIEIVFKGIEKTILSDETNAFYRGGTISWRDLAEQKDLLRYSTDIIQRRLEFQLNENKLQDVQLIHEAGAGGTTIARRVAFNLSTKYPTVILRKYSHKKTIDAIRIIYDQYVKGSLPLLIIAESFEVKDSNSLYRDLSNEKKNAVIFIVHRGLLSKAKNKKFILKAQLEGNEITAFEASYKSYNPENGEKVSNITRDYKDSPSYISPVLYALTAFGKNYDGLENYVNKCIEGITLEQKKLTGFICLIHYYTQKSVPIELFCTLFNVDRSRCNLSELLGNENPLFELLHQEVNHDDEYYNDWRPRYALLGEEAMKIILAGGTEHKKNWKNYLGNWLVDLVSYVRMSMPILDDYTAQIFNSLFIERSHLDDNGHDKEFTKSFDDLYNSDSGVAIFEALIASYPDEAHFHGHYARYLYSDKIGIKDYDKAITEAEASLSIAPDNSSLIHTLGMCYKEKAENLIYTYEKQGLSPEEAEESIKIMIESACDKFDECIENDPYNIYGYESQIRVILRTLDFGFKIHNATSKESFITNVKNNWYAERLDKVSQLLEEALYAIEQLKKVENKDKVQKSEGYILDCEAIFFKTLGKHLSAKTKFEELVKNTPKGYEYMRPHYRRMFVMCLLASKAQDQKAIFQAWNGISESELNQCVEYLDANIFEDPNNVQNIRLWLQAIRHLKNPPHIVNAISKIAAWTQVSSQNDNSLLEGYYYLYVLNSIKAISDGNTFDPTTVQIVKDVLEKMKPFVKNEKFCFEWYGKGTGLHQMVNHRELGDFTNDFFDKNKNKITEVTGRIKSIQSTQQGTINLDCGLEAFFVPNVHAFTERNINDRVRCYIGFRYDQIQAWSVLLINVERDHSTKIKEERELESFIEEPDEIQIENLRTDVPVIKKIENVEPPKLEGPKVIGQLTVTKNKPEEGSAAIKVGKPLNNIDYNGIIKVLNHNKGYISVEGLDKDIAFIKTHVPRMEFSYLAKKVLVKVKIKFLNGKPLMDSSNRNYIAERVCKL